MIINGDVAWSEGRHTGARSGQVLGRSAAARRRAGSLAGAPESMAGSAPALLQKARSLLRARMAPRAITAGITVSPAGPAASIWR